MVAAASPASPSATWRYESADRNTAGRHGGRRHFGVLARGRRRVVTQHVKDVYAGVVVGEVDGVVCGCGSDLFTVESGFDHGTQLERKIGPKERKKGARRWDKRIGYL